MIVVAVTLVRVLSHTHISTINVHINTRERIQTHKYFNTTHTHRVHTPERNEKFEDLNWERLESF